MLTVIPTRQCTGWDTEPYYIPAKATNVSDFQHVSQFAGPKVIDRKTHLQYDSGTGREAFVDEFSHLEIQRILLCVANIQVYRTIKESLSKP